ncbi:MAG: ATP-binding protein [Candidatus Cloacimonetes bacterium]|nr:ATP-binding protein [Candidatus Cloacimonadota bacterium]
MLISFTVKNWKSFKDVATLNMVATNERHHNERLHRNKKYKLRVLPTAAIYGGNASGKSNFINAIEFAQKLIVRGTSPEEVIPIISFALSESNQNPSEFEFRILLQDSVFIYSFSLNRERVISESLIKLHTNKEKIIFNRKGESFSAPHLQKNDRLYMIAEITPMNQLLLTRAVDSFHIDLKEIYSWFKNKLVIASPNDDFNAVNRLLLNIDFLNEVSTVMNHFDTGIHQLVAKPLDTTGTPPISVLELNYHKRGTSLFYKLDSQKRNLMQLYQLATVHKDKNGEDIEFDFSMESDGSKRLMGILPNIIAFRKMEFTFIIDELDRSLHTHVSRKLIEDFFAGISENSRSQLIFTTHDVLLMNQELLRRDEMWVTERDENGASTLYSFSEFKDIRKDKDIRKSYLQGRLGGVPKILLDTAVTGE